MYIKVSGCINVCEPQISMALKIVNVFLPLLPHSITKAFMLHQASLFYTCFSCFFNCKIICSIYSIYSMYLGHIHLPLSPAPLNPQHNFMSFKNNPQMQFMFPKFSYIWSRVLKHRKLTNGQQEEFPCPSKIYFPMSCNQSLWCL